MSANGYIIAQVLEKSKYNLHLFCEFFVKQ